jgi:hypothetical protein
VSESDELLLYRMARNYSACMVPIPDELAPVHLPVPDEAQQTVYEGLLCLHGVIASLYDLFATWPKPDEKEASDERTCYQAIEGPVVLLWGLGVAGCLSSGPDGAEWIVDKAELRKVTPARRLKNLAAVVPALERVGFAFACYDADGSVCTRGLSRCASAALRYVADPARSEALLCALAFYARCLDLNEGDAGWVAFARADYRVLVSGADPAARSYTEAEALRTMDPATAALWHDLARYTAERYPHYVQAFRIPSLRHRCWTADYTTTGKGYGIWSTYGDAGGFRVRMVFRPKGRAYLLEHLDELSPKMQEAFLNGTSCRDCKSCGEHLMYLHGDHVHKLCKAAWFYSPYLEAEDMASVERMVDIQVAHLR